jgi:cob(I)alamin adenosyltransferase
MKDRNHSRIQKENCLRGKPPASPPLADFPLPQIFGRQASDSPPGFLVFPFAKGEEKNQKRGKSLEVNRRVAPKKFSVSTSDIGSRPRRAQGLVQVYTGNGKGKTTAALGLAWRAMGHGLKVCFVQFLKGKIKSGEELLNPFGEQFTFVQISAEAEGLGRKSAPGKSWWEQEPGETDRTFAKAALEFARTAVTSGDYDLVVCDEINVACHLGLISTADILSLMREKPAQVELVLTGRDAKKEVITAADLVIEMQMIKHPFEKNVPARKGIEY